MKKQFKAESKKLLDLMINSIYTNKDIFLRELISNASDAIDKLYYKSLTDKNIKLKNLEITIDIDKENRTLSITDNGLGMTKEELDNNLGTIAKSGSLAFKEENEKKKGIDIIGKFGVGFYSSFMISDNVKVISKAYGEETAYKWESNGISGFTINEENKEEYGTTIILRLKENNEDEIYDEYLEEQKLKDLIKKYSDYITYPIKINNEIINSMTPIWNKQKNKVKQEEYDNFYMEKFSDYEGPQKTININAEGLVTYKGLLFIPNHAPFDFFTKEYEKGLQLYSNGVLIMDKCKELLPDYFSFVKGVIDSPDLPLNISRETLQKNKILINIAKNIENKIKKELENLLKKDREKYELFFNNFGIQIKYGLYNNYGIDKDKLKDLVLFYSSKEKKLVTLKEYIERMDKNQNKIFYACGESIDKIDLLPQVESFKEKYEVLYLNEVVDEFAIQALDNYEDKKFINVASKEATLDTKEKQEEIDKTNENNKEMFEYMKKEIKGVKEIRFTHKLKNHPVCLSSEGNISVGMEKTLNAMPMDQKINAETILEINETHPIAKKLKKLYKTDKNILSEYTKILYAEARLIEGLPIDNPTEITNLMSKLMSK